MTTHLDHEPDASRYVLRHGSDLIAVVDYATSATAVSFTHTFTAPHLRGRGHAAEVVGFAVDDVENTTDLRIVPMCWYVAEWFDAHPERAHLLTRGR